MKKWSLRIVIGVVALVLLLLAAVQVVLWTSMPRQWVLSALQQKLQLKVSAQSFSTGWGGRTSLSDVTLGLPLAEESFLQTPSLTVEHTGLLALLVGRPLEVKSVTIDRPNVLVRQMPDGRWNLQEVAALVSRASGGKTAEGSPPQPRTGAQGGPTLPKVTIREGTIRVLDLAGRQSTLQPINVAAAPDGPLVWRLELTESDRLKVTGQVAPGGDWSHQADIELRNLGPLIKPLLVHPSASTVAALEQFKLSGHWTGRAAGTLGGRLDLKELFVGGGWGATATGPVHLSFADGVATILPAGLVITPPKQGAGETPPAPPLRAASGAIYLDGRSATAKELSLGFAGGEVRLSSSYAWDSGSGRIDASWNKLAWPAGTIHGGTLTASLAQPWPNQPLIAVDIVTHGHRGEADTWSARVDLGGVGSAWDQIDWTLKAPALAYTTPEQAYNLDGINAKLATRGQVFTLDRIDVPPGNLYGKWKRGKLEGQGRYDMNSQQWFAYVTGTGWPVSPTASTPANFLIDVYGDATWARLKDFFLEGAGVQMTARGDISYRTKGLPADLHLYTKSPPVNYVWRERDADPRDDVKFAGRLYSEVHVTGGAANPMRLDITGKLFAHDFTANGHPVGDVVLRISGRANDDALTLATDRLKLFGGEWDFAGRYQWKDRLTKVNVELAEMSLAQLDNFVKPPPNIRGTLEGRWIIEVPEFDLNRMKVDGEYKAQRVAKVNAPPPTTLPTVAAAARDRDADRQAVQATMVGGPQAQAPRTQPPPVRTTVDASASRPATTAPTTQPSITPIADLITGKVAGADGTVTFDPIQLRLRGGRTDAKASFAVTAPRQVHLEMVSAAWPSDFTDRRGRPNNILVWLNTTLDLDLKKLEARGPLHVQQAVISNQTNTIAVLSAEADVLGRRLDVRTITGKGLGGSISGDGYVYLDAPLQSSGRLDWKEIDAESITALQPATAGLVGKFSGAARFAPVTASEDRDAAGPFRVTGTITADHAALNGMQIGNANFTLYCDFQRSVLRQFDWNIAGGMMHGWARFTNYGGDKFAHVNVSFEKLDLDQIIQAARPPEQDHKPVPGRVGGYVTAAGNPFTARGQREASGEAMIRLTDSDLANVSIVNALYTILSVKWGQTQPTGRGFVQARLEGQRLEIPVARYSNRGVDIWANLCVVDLFKGRESPIEGTAAGSARPLKDLKLPFMADVDKVLAALQGGLATVRVEGTVKEPKPKVIPFSAAGDTFRRFMLGEVKEATKGTAGR